jgi:hypothetical protein
VHIDATDGSEDVAEAIRATEADTEEDVRDMQEDEAMTRQALDVLNSRRNDPYEAATAALREDTQQWWADTLARDSAERRARLVLDIRSDDVQSVLGGERFDCIAGAGRILFIGRSAEIGASVHPRPRRFD